MLWVIIKCMGGKATSYVFLKTFKTFQNMSETPFLSYLVISCDRNWVYCHDSWALLMIKTDVCIDGDSMPDTCTWHEWKEHKLQAKKRLTGWASLIRGYVAVMNMYLTIHTCSFGCSLKWLLRQEYVNDIILTTDHDLWLTVWFLSLTEFEHFPNSVLFPSVKAHLAEAPSSEEETAVSELRLKALFHLFFCGTKTCKKSKAVSV